MEIKVLKLNTVFFLQLFLLLLIVFSSCFSFAKSGDIFTLRKQAETQLEQGNKEADRGGLETALLFLDEAMRLAVAADAPALRIRIKLSRSNVLFSSGSGEKAVQGWNEALAESQNILRDEEMAAICRFHIARGRLLSDDKGAVRQIRDDLDRDLTLIKKDRFYTAFAWTVIALAEKELGSSADAETAVKRALKIHEKDRYFELAAYDWYTIASFRSLAADYKGAILALENAIAFDRRIENSWGLASDWRAMGDVHTRTGDHSAARAAYLRAAEIFSALGNEEAAAQALFKVESR